jgi:hypothetical protein
MKNQLLSFLFAAAFAVSSFTAKADKLDFGGGYYLGTTGFNDTVGYAIQIGANPISVYQFGAFGGANMGGIWDTAGNLITSFNLPHIFNSGQYSWKGVNLDNPIILESNKIYYLGAANPTYGWNANTYVSVPASVHPNVTFIGTVRSQKLYEFAFPNAIDPTQNGAAGVAMVGPDISFNVAPEPSTYALLGLGAIGMLIVMRRKKTV